MELRDDGVTEIELGPSVSLRCLGALRIWPERALRNRPRGSGRNSALCITKMRVGRMGSEALEAPSCDLAPGESVRLAHYVESQDLQGTILPKLVLFPVRNSSHCLLGTSGWMALILIWGTMQEITLSWSF